MSIFTLAISHTPALGKGQALRAALEEHTNASNAAGGRYSLSQRMGAAEFTNNMQFDGLAAMDAYRAAAPGDAARRARLGKVAECLASPQTSRLFEAVAGGPPPTPPAYVLRVEFTPAVGKNAELRKALEERAKTTPKGALGSGLGVEVAPETGAKFIVQILLASLAGLEEFRSANQSDPTFAAWQTKLAGLISEQPRMELRSILVPFPSR